MSGRARDIEVFMQRLGTGGESRVPEEIASRTSCWNQGYVIISTIQIAQQVGPFFRAALMALSTCWLAARGMWKCWGRVGTRRKLRRSATAIAVFQRGHICDVKGMEEPSSQASHYLMLCIPRTYLGRAGCRRGKCYGG